MFLVINNNSFEVSCVSPLMSVVALVSGLDAVCFFPPNADAVVVVVACQ